MITQITTNGNNQMVSIPKEFHLAEGDIEIIKRNDELIIRPLRKNLSEAFEILASLSDDGVEPLTDALPQAREEWT